MIPACVSSVSSFSIERKAVRRKTIGRNCFLSLKIGADIKKIEAKKVPVSTSNNTKKMAAIVAAVQHHKNLKG